MLHLKIFSLLRTLTKAELESFHQYLNYRHGNERIALALFAYVKKFYPDFKDERKLKMEYAYRKVFGTEIGKNRKQVLNSMSDLYQWLRSFLLCEKIIQGSFESRLLWLSILQERGLKSEMERQASRLKTDLEGSPKASSFGYLQAVNLDHFMHYHLAKNEFSSRESENLALFYTLFHLKLACEKANFRNMKPEAAKTLEPPLLFDVLPIQSKTEEPLLRLYWEVYQLLVNHQAESFNLIEAMLPEVADHIALHELNIILRFLHNYAASQIRQGKEVFWKRVHQMNKFTFGRGMFTHKGIISGLQFNNIVSAACNAGESFWAESFVDAQSHLLHEDIRAEVIMLAKATIFFEEKKFEQTLQVLADSDCKDFLNNIRCKALILKSFYETKVETDRVWDFCANFETYLRRHLKPNGEAVKATLKFIQIFKMLLRKKAGKEEIRQKINADGALYFRTWLLEKTAVYKADFATPR